MEWNIGWNDLDTGHKTIKNLFNSSCAPMREYTLHFSLRSEAFCESLDYIAED